MTAVTINRFKRRKATKSGVVKKTVVAPSGQSVSIRSIPANGPTFTDDFMRVFSANVSEALKASTTSGSTKTKTKQRQPRMRRAAADS